MALHKLLFRPGNHNWMQRCGFKHFPPPPNFDHIELPERKRLTILDRIPTFPPGMRAPKMQKRLRYMRGPEPVHNFLLHKQYGLMATGGGRLKWQHIEIIRLNVGRMLDMSRMFAVWRVDAPWQPVTKKGQGQRMGGGKGAIDHYVTPVKAGRIIFEIGGKCEYEEVRDKLERLCKKLPFDAIAVSQEILEKRERKEKEDEERNVNPYTMKYLIQNNMGGCQRWIAPIDLKWFGKYH